MNPINQEFVDAELLKRLKRSPNSAMRNPFEPLDIKGPFDQKSQAHETKLDKGIFSLLQETFQQHRQGYLSPPIITLVGNTGTGKSHILNQLVRQSIQRDQVNAFFVPVEPEDLLRNVQDSLGVVQCLLQAFKQILFYEQDPGFAPIRPIDACVHLLFETIVKNSEQPLEDVLRFPKSFLSFAKKGRAYPQCILDTLRFPTHELRVTFCEVKKQLKPPQFMLLLKDMERLIDRYGQVYRPVENLKTSRIKKQMKLLLRLAFADKSDVEAYCKKQPHNTTTLFELAAELQDWIELTTFLHFPVIFVFDQFEDLQFVRPEPLDVLLRQFLLLLFDAVRFLESGGDALRVPAFLLAISESSETFLQGKDPHIRDRFPLLPHGKQFLDLTEIRLRQFQQDTNALMLTRAYLDVFWKSCGLNRDIDVESDWPFTTELLQGMHEFFRKNSFMSPRQWLQLCRDSWSFLVTSPSTASLAQRRIEWRQKMKVGNDEEVRSPEPVSSDHESGSTESTRGAKHGFSGSPPSEPSNEPEPSTLLMPAEKWSQLLQNKIFQGLVRDKISRFTTTQELSVLYSKFVLLLKEFNCTAIRNPPQIFNQQQFGLSQTISTFVTSTNHTRIFLGCSRLSNRGGGFGGELGQMENNIRILKKGNHIAPDESVRYDVPLMLRITDENPPSEQANSVITHSLLPSGQVGMDTLQVFAALFVKNDPLVTIPEIKHNLTWSEMGPILKETVTTQWGFFATIAARGL